ncbi:hypothetical protein CHS0354_025751 [Potamilus streckersoni]|uniref:Metalloendopeptidase n=1 Tax=Potamilus streckersoni TaxID=2493646 RepID=A0AAE0RUQ5_9BIVA|nr:hypothetical protein CHS0354_025751 [Potamilus streckersoni]
MNIALVFRNSRKETHEKVISSIALVFRNSRKGNLEYCPCLQKLMKRQAKVCQQQFIGYKKKEKGGRRAMNMLGCQSSIGRDGGEQFIVLGESCYYKGVIMHEMTHAVGFFHEQNRFDRDDYITMHWKNIEPGKELDFQIQQKDVLTTLGAPYDYGSIMHYGPYTFAKEPKQEVMTPKYDPHVQMGQRDGFSELDIWKINTLYGCDSGPPPSPSWMQYLSSTIKITTPSQTPSRTSVSTKSTQKTTPVPGLPGKPTVLVNVFPNAVRINWEKPDSSEQITGYIITYKLEPDGQPMKILVSPNKLAYYLNTYTTHPGRRYTISVAAVTNTTVGPESDPTTVRSACSHDVYLDEGTYNQIHSPFFKYGYYEQDVICQWKFTAPERQRVNLTFRHLNIDGGPKGCTNDVLRIGDSDDFCNIPPTNGYYLSKGNKATVTFMSRPGPSEVKAGGFDMSASAEATAFNISWHPPGRKGETPREIHAGKF